MSRTAGAGGHPCVSGGHGLFSSSTLSAPLPGESRVGTWGRNPELRPLSDGPDLGHEQGGHPIEYPGHNSRSPGALPETFPSHPPHAPRGSTAVPTLLPAPGALAPASPGCISGLRSLCCVPSPVRPLRLGLERDLAHRSTSHAPPDPHARRPPPAFALPVGPCAVPSRAQSPSEHRVLPLSMAQPAFSSTPWSAQFRPPALHPSLALLGEVIPPGLFKMSLPLAVRWSSPRPSGSSGVPEPSTCCLLCYWPPVTLQGRGNVAASGARLWPALVLMITNDLTEGWGVPPD